MGTRSQHSSAIGSAPCPEAGLEKTYLDLRAASAGHFTLATFSLDANWNKIVQLLTEVKV
jgi:hypothetical protein